MPCRCRRTSNDTETLRPFRPLFHDTLTAGEVMKVTVIYVLPHYSNIIAIDQLMGLFEVRVFEKRVFSEMGSSELVVKEQATHSVHVFHDLLKVEI